MALLMTCDRCGAEVPASINGTVRLKLGSTEYAFHLCEFHQKQLFADVASSVTVGALKRIGSGVRDERKLT